MYIHTQYTNSHNFNFWKGSFACKGSLNIIGVVYRIAGNFDRGNFDVFDNLSCQFFRSNKIDKRIMTCGNDSELKVCQVAIVDVYYEVF